MLDSDHNHLQAHEGPLQPPTAHPYTYQAEGMAQHPMPAADEGGAQTPLTIDQANEASTKPRSYLLKFGPWWQFSHASDMNAPKTRILPGIAGICMPVTILFVLTSVEANWIQSGPGFGGHRLTKATGYVVGNAFAVAFGFMSAFTVFFRQTDYFRKYTTVKTAMLIQVAFNVIIGVVCILTGALYQRNKVLYKDVWVTPEYPCIFIGGFFAFLQVVLLLLDYALTPNFNQRGSGMGPSMQGAMGIANIVNIWTGFGSLVFSNVENTRVWHPYNSCYNSWVTLITTSSVVLNYETVNSKVFIFFWLPIGLLIMIVYFVCFAIGVIERFDSKPRKRIREAEKKLLAVYRDLRRNTLRTNKHKARGSGYNVEIRNIRNHIKYLQNQRLLYFLILFFVGIVLKVCSWLLGSIIFTLTESGWSYWDSMFFLFMNLLTVGIQGMVPTSAAGMPLYHAYTYLDVLSTAALDGLLFHILYNLVPWSHCLSQVKGMLVAGFGRVSRKKKIGIDTEADKNAQSSRNYEDEESSSLSGSLGSLIGGEDKHSNLGLEEAAAHQLEDILNTATRMRMLLIQNSANKADLSEYDQLLETAELHLDEIFASQNTN